MLRFIRTLSPRLNESFIVKFSYILFFVSVPLTKSVSYVGYSLSIVLMVYFCYVNDGGRVMWNKIIKSPLTYFLGYLLILNALHHIAFVKSQIEMKLLCYSLIMVATNYFLKRNIITLRFLYSSFLGIALLLLIDGYWQYFFGTDFILNRTLGNEYYVISAMKHWNSFGLLMFFSYILVVYFLFEKSSKLIYKILAIFSLLAILGMILLSGSRSVWLSTIGFSMIILYYKRQELSWKVWGPLIGVSVSGVLCISYFILSVWARVLMIFQGNSSGRGSIWLYFLGKIPENWLFGHGLTSPHYIPSLKSSFLYPHNLTIEIVYSFGIVGFGVVVFWFYKMFLAFRNVSDTYIRFYVVASFLALFLLQQQFETSIFIHKVAGSFLFLYLGIVYFLISNSKQKVVS